MNSKSSSETKITDASSSDVELKDSNAMSCSVHGSSQTTFVCKHLAENPVQKWNCGYPEEDDQWPDAWCNECNAAYEQEGEWNERNDGIVDIKLLCSGCYDDGIAKSVDRLAGDTLLRWENWSNKCCKVFSEKQSVLREKFGINQYPRWDYDQESGQLIFSGADAPDLIADVEFVGTLSTTGKTWKWAWANFSLLPQVRSRISAVRDFGEARDYPSLIVPMWYADQPDGWHMTGIAAEILGAQGGYRVPNDYGFTFMVMMEVHFARAK